MKTTIGSYFIRGTSALGRKLHWNGEKFTDQGEAWSFDCLEDAEFESIQRENMDEIGIYGWPKKGGAAVFVKKITP
jgi:hypothetical protein